jgi:glycosyl transferase family 25
MGKEKEIGIDHIYVVHAPTGYERHEKRLQCVLGEKYGFDYQFIEKDAEDLISSYFVSDAGDTWNRGTLMCTLNHIMFYELMIKNNDNIALILEDDPYFSRHFIENLRIVVEEAKKLPEGFFISLENSTLKFPPRTVIRKGKHLYGADFGRCAGAYLLDQTAARNIIKHLKQHKCDQVIDHWHNKLIKENVFKMFWAHPAFVEQGSLNGKMSSTNSSRIAGFTRRISWILQKYYKLYLR